MLKATQLVFQPFIHQGEQNVHFSPSPKLPISRVEGREKRKGGGGGMCVENIYLKLLQPRSEDSSRNVYKLLAKLKV